MLARYYYYYYSVFEHLVSDLDIICVNYSHRGHQHQRKDTSVSQDEECTPARYISFVYICMFCTYIYILQIIG